MSCRMQYSPLFCAVVVVALVLVIPLFVSGCGKEAKEGGGDPNYYTGPLKPKAERMQGAKTDPNEVSTPAKR